jgi:hypothetical protein
MIARATGEIQFPSDGVRISPSLTREEFLASGLARGSRELVRNEPHCTFALPAVQFDAHQFAWSLSFHGSHLRSVSIACADPEFGSSWSDWSEERERARKQCHDSLLASVLGADWSRQRFTWGSVYSVFDQKSGGSSIGVTYDNAA